MNTIVFRSIPHKTETKYSPPLERWGALREINFSFLSNPQEYDRGDSFPWSFPREREADPLPPPSKEARLSFWSQEMRNVLKKNIF